MGEFRAFTDIPYDTADPRQQYDLYRPKGDTSVPLVTLIHGGGWAKGSREQYRDTCALLVDEGFAAATVGYRLSPQVQWPEIAYDVARGMAHIMAHAGDYSIDPRKTVTWGSSAGGHLALVVQAWSECWVRDRLVGRVPDVVGTVAQCPVTKVPDPDVPARGEDTFGPNAPLEQTSPWHTPHTRFQSVLVVHGDADETVPLADSREFVDRLSLHEVDARLVVLPGAPHAFGYNVAGEHAQECLRVAVPYLREKLTPAG